jgi:hypothetical protein
MRRERPFSAACQALGRRGLILHGSGHSRMASCQNRSHAEEAITVWRDDSVRLVMQHLATPEVAVDKEMRPRSIALRSFPCHLLRDYTHAGPEVVPWILVPPSRDFIVPPLEAWVSCFDFLKPPHVAVASQLKVGELINRRRQQTSQSRFHGRNSVNLAAAIASRTGFIASLCLKSREPTDSLVFSQAAISSLGVHHRPNSLSIEAGDSARKAMRVLR